MSPLARLCLALLLPALILSAAQAVADRATAEYFAERGEKALRAKDWKEAEKFFRRALEEDELFLPARLGLSESLLGSGQRALAIQELRRLCGDADGVADLPTAWKSSLRKARRLLAKIDELGTELDKLLGDHLDALLKFASHWKSKDPDMAARAVTQALALKPEHKQAAALLKEIGLGRDEGFEPLFDGKGLAGWAQMSAPQWVVVDGILRGTCPPETAYMGRTEKRFQGEYDLRMEARLVEKDGRVPHFGLVAGMTEEHQRVVLGWLKDAVSVLEYTGTKDSDELFSALPRNMVPPFSVTSWNVFELRFRKDRIHAVVNGKEVHDLRRRPERENGYVGLVLQDAKIEIKRIEFRQR